MRNVPVRIPTLAWLLGLLTALLVTMRVVGTITWPWWWVFAPIWLPLLGFATFVFLYLAALAVRIFLLLTEYHLHHAAQVRKLTRQLQQQAAKA